MHHMCMSVLTFHIHQSLCGLSATNFTTTGRTTSAGVDIFDRRSKKRSQIRRQHFHPSPLRSPSLVFFSPLVFSSPCFFSPLFFPSPFFFPSPLSLLPPCFLLPLHLVFSPSPCSPPHPTPSCPPSRSPLPLSPLCLPPCFSHCFFPLFFSCGVFSCGVFSCCVFFDVWFLGYLQTIPFPETPPPSYFGQVQ